MRVGMQGLLRALCGLALAAGSVRAQEALAPEAGHWVRGVNASGLALFRREAGEAGNTVLSPWSLGTAMTMALAGAGGETAEEMAGVLALRPVRDRLDAAQAGAQASLASLADAEGIAFASVQGLALGPAADLVTEAFVERLERQYGAEIFRSPSHGGPINAWVNRHTQGRIPTIIDENLSPNMVCVLLNAVYFKGLWALPFDPERTRDVPFRRPGAEPMRVPMMQRTADYRVGTDGGTRILELPYAGERAVLLVALPEDEDGLDALVAGLDAERAARWLAGLAEERARRTDVRLPRFTIHAAYPGLRETYAAMGIRRAFSSTLAQFPHLTGRDEPGLVWIDQIIHKAMIEVNEEGTEAAAATAVVMVTRAMPAPPRTFHADRPFLFLLADRATGAILFLGRVDDPSAE